MIKNVKEFNDWKKAKELIFSNYNDLYNDFIDEVETTSLNSIIKTGIDEIDNTIIGIFKSSLVVIAGETGAGKSLLASNIAFNAIKQDCRVVYFDLENDSGEFLRRQLARQLNKEGHKISHAELRIKEYFNKKENIIGKAIGEMGDKLKHKLLVYNNIKIPTIDDFIQYLEMVEVGTDLVVIDHLHYFEFESSQSDSENIGRIMRALRGITKEKRIPIILVSHLRKKQSKTYNVGNDDLYGSSNIAKEAETVIILSKDSDDMNKISVTKNRNVGVVRSWHYDKEGYEFTNLKNYNISDEDFSFHKQQ